MVRAWLSSMLRGDFPAREFPDDAAHEDILDEANSQGVIALLHDHASKCSQRAAIPSAFQELLAQRAHEKARQSLMREAECRRILSRFQDAGIKALLLKGSALAYWAYPSANLRDCSDIDFLFSSCEQAQAAIRVLQDMQYILRDPVLAGDLVSYEQTCVRNSEHGSGLEIDLHWRLSSSPVFAYRFDFDELQSKAIRLPRLGADAYGLSPLHAFFNACMHRIQNMADGSENSLKWLYDLHLLSFGFTQDDWKNLVALSVEKKLAGVSLDGLQASIREFKTSIPDTASMALAEAAKIESMKVVKMDRWFYIQRMSFSAFPTFGLRMRWLKQRLFPDTAYLQARYGGKSNFFTLITQRFFAGMRRLFR